MKKYLFLFAVLIAAVIFGGCVSTHSTITSSTPQIELKPEHLEVTEQREATGVTTRIFGIDWERLMNSRSASMRGTVYSSMISFDRTEEYAIYGLLKQNEGYDMVMYPKFTKVVRKPVMGIGAICTITEVKVSARLAKLKF
ncbi:MAG: hypothetical protein J6Y98_05145 [Bacteroidales bacterium]|nr:hypothetical protein [Bacteroidales bacterium]